MSNVVLAEYTKTFQQINSLTPPVKAVDVEAMAAEVARLRETKKDQAELIRSYEKVIASQVGGTTVSWQDVASNVTHFKFSLPNELLVHHDSTMAALQGFFQAVVKAVTGRDPR